MKRIITTEERNQITYRFQLQLNKLIITNSLNWNKDHWDKIRTANNTTQIWKINTHAKRERSIIYLSVRQRRRLNRAQLPKKSVINRQNIQHTRSVFIYILAHIFKNIIFSGVCLNPDKAKYLAQHIPYQK